MGTYEKKCNKLQAHVSAMQSENHALKMRVRELGQRLHKEASKVSPLKAQVDALSAERGQWLRKLKRAGLK